MGLIEGLFEGVDVEMDYFDAGVSNSIDKVYFVDTFGKSVLKTNKHFLPLPLVKA